MPDFRKEDGSSRILALWDQELEREFSQEQIDEALQASEKAGTGRWSCAEHRPPGHGTAVAAIKLPGANPAEGLRRGANRLVVKLSQKQNGYPHTTQLMSAVSGRFPKLPKIRAATRHQHQLRN